MTLDRIYITFEGNIALENLFIEDLNTDTLLYSRSLTANIPIWPVITDGRITVKDLRWEGVRANIYRKESQDFNYQFLIDAFSPQDTLEVVTDTTSSSTDISIHKVLLSDIYATYHDREGGLSAYVNLGELLIDANETDLDSMKFEVSSALLKNTRFSYEQSKPFPESPESTGMPLPFLTLEDIEVSNVAGVYESIPDGIEARVDIQDFKLKAPKADIQKKQIHIASVALSDSEIEFITF